MSTARWRRGEYGWLSPDGRAYAERGAPMSDGGTAWLVWFRWDRPFERTCGGTGSPFCPEDGDIMRQGDELDPKLLDDTTVWNHRNDAGSLTEAKLTAAAVLDHVDCKRTLQPGSEGVVSCP